jgi:hypothetical protein
VHYFRVRRRSGTIAQPPERLCTRKPVWSIANWQLSGYVIGRPGSQTQNPGEPLKDGEISADDSCFSWISDSRKTGWADLQPRVSLLLLSQEN